MIAEVRISIEVAATGHEAVELSRLGLGLRSFLVSHCRARIERPCRNLECRVHMKRPTHARSHAVFVR